ncbi:hypothetical protein I312_102782 [Cryptococcus bacillisporus CA1280]|uniref:uncharacterized protein n=1 Tax=Cryptococcus bacillisporus CA1280 TaxID=1296109 RepID=UPI003368ED82
MVCVPGKTGRCEKGDVMGEVCAYVVEMCIRSDMLIGSSVRSRIWSHQHAHLVTRLVRRQPNLSLLLHSIHLDSPPSVTRNPEIKPFPTSPETYQLSPSL